MARNAFQVAPWKARTDLVVVPVRKRVTRQADRTLLGRDSSSVAELVGFTAPEKCLAKEAGGSDTKSQQVAERV